VKLEELVLSALKARGVEKARLLAPEERARVRELEELYSRRATPLGKPVNLGVIECLQRRYVVAALTSPTFEWPSGPYAVIKVGDVEVGSLNERGISINVRSFRKARGEHLIVYLPLRIPELEALLKDAVAASPSPPTHSYLAKLLGGKGGQQGTLLVGFNYARRPVKFPT